MKGALLRYRVMATIVGVLLIVLCLVGLPLHYGYLLFPDALPEGGRAWQVGADISQYLGVAHGWLYMIFVVMAFLLSRKAGWDLPFTAGHPRLAAPSRSCPSGPSTGPPDGSAPTSPRPAPTPQTARDSPSRMAPVGRVDRCQT